ncbi:MAG: hypothetical protein KF749_07815 [Bacteroidetes bacterium]|nr:hypothetical protein [Bacteroidota bacterium]MCW5894950.1 hypothetical protein [Bacteroidota bacterium]
MNKIWQCGCFLLLIMLVSSGCSKKSTEGPLAPPTTDTDMAIASCIGCHTDYTTLKRIASPDTSGGGGGCGGEFPHIEVYDRVYLGGAGFQKFRASTHGQIACTHCHGGVDSTSNKQVAHSGDFVKYPSARPATKCAQCHYNTVQNHASSLHANGWGQKSMVTLRYGANSFDDLPATLKTGYNNHCASCHAEKCGDCHINRPTAGGGGLLRGHSFERRPDMRENCVACHSSRVGHGYFGIGSGTQPDVHSTKWGDGHCVNCHSNAEIHGDGNIYNQRYKVAFLPWCTGCHSNIANSNPYHTAHMNSFNCQTCHSQDYNNCGSCHVGGAGARVPAYLGFKIGMNPITGTRPFKYATLRRALMAPDSWQNYGVANLANFDVRPTYKYATPHNTLRWTSRTRVEAGRACYDNCHIINENGTYRNKHLYLFNSDLLSWEIPANAGVVVDGKLPASWGTP